jgi:signal transduction histidine kinase
LLGPGLPALAVSLALAIVQVTGTHFAAQNQPDRAPLDAAGYALLLAGPVALLGRQRYSVPALWAVMGVTLVYMLAGYPYGPVFLSVIVALYAAVTSGHRVAAWTAAAALYACHFGARYFFDIDAQPTLGQLGFVAAWLLVVLAGSEVIRARRESLIEAEQTRQEETRRRASEERLVIARELHDVLAHNISLINVQAGVALHLMDRQPEQARQALTAIEGASRDALTELRSVLDIMRRPEEAAPRAPSPGLARLSGIVSQARAAGLEVESRIEGVAQPLPAPIDAAAFRVVQEALTNVIKHAGASRATIGLQYGEHELTLQVDDDGRAYANMANAGGSGIAGMRERVTALGGSFQAGPSPGGRGFRVRAQFPIDGRP